MNINPNSLPPSRYLSAVRFSQVQTAKKERARRAVYLPSELFAEPAWDILLELYAFELVARMVNESELGERINVPATTTSRWLKVLDAQDLIARSVDPNDASQVRVVLTQRALEALEGYFSDVG